MSIITLICGNITFSELVNDDNTVIAQLDMENRNKLIRSGIPERVVTVKEDGNE